MRTKSGSRNAIGDSSHTLTLLRLANLHTRVDLLPLPLRRTGPRRAPEASDRDRRTKRIRHLTYRGMLCGTHRDAHMLVYDDCLPVPLFLSMTVRDFWCHVNVSEARDER